MRRREVMVIIGGAAASWVRLNEHMEHPQGAVVFQHIQSLREKSINVTGYKPDTNTRRSRVIAQGDLFEGATTRARPASPRVRSGPRGRPGNPLESSHGALSVARCQSRAPHAMTSNNNAEGLARFLKLPPGASLRLRVEKQSLDRAVETPTYPGMSVFQVRLNSPLERWCPQLRRAP
jgi:hypothetical protein